MFGKQITVFTLFGFKVRIDLSWLILAVFITWSLAQGVFLYYYEGLSTTAYWWMGIFGAIGLFASIIFHELWHSLVAMKALSRINRTKNSRLMVVDKNNQLVGILSLKDLLRFLSLKLDLEDEVLEKTGL